MNMLTVTDDILEERLILKRTNRHVFYKLPENTKFGKIIIKL